MSESNPENQQQDVQDPAEPYQVDEAVSTEDQPVDNTSVQEGSDAAPVDYEGETSSDEDDPDSTSVQEGSDSEPVQVDVETPEGQADVHVVSGEGESSES